MIYILTDGEYSDYHIIAATTDKDKAEELAAKLYCDVEEYEEIKIDVKDREVYRVKMLKNGDTKNIYIDTYHSDLEEKYIIGYDKTLLVNWCWAKDEKHAIKITNELRTRLIAEGKFK